MRPALRLERVTRRSIPQAETTAARHEPSGLRNRDGHRRRCRVGHVLTIAALRYLPAFQLSQRDIAGELHVSLNTVKTHCQANYHKLGVGDRTSAVQAARDARLL